MKLGSLFTGYGGLDLAAEAVFDARTVWTSDIDPGACKIIAERFPGVPNLGDLTAVDWSAVEPVDILTGGFPCQDLSAAGKRAGLRPGTRSGLWSHFAYAINQIRPAIVIVENVRGLLDAEAHSDMESCPVCVGDRSDGSLRALGAVLGDLAGLGYDAQWYGLRASDVGAPHGRFRIFLLATDTQGWQQQREHHQPGLSTQPGNGAATAQRAPDPSSITRGLDQNIAGLRRSGPHDRTTVADTAGPARAGRGALPESAESDRGRSHHGNRTHLLPTPTARDWKDGQRVQAVPINGLLGRTVWLLPTPDTWGKGRWGNGHQSGSNLHHIDHLLPTPTATDAKVSGGGYGGQDNVTLTDAIVRNADQFGHYAPVISRWEQTIGREAPAPTVDRRLSPRFVEWMMGLPDGWVSDVPDLGRPAQLKALGNGVVPQQAAEGLLRLLFTCLTDDASPPVAPNEPPAQRPDDDHQRSHDAASHNPEAHPR